MKAALLNPEKVAISYFASIEKEVSRMYKKAHAQEAPSSHQQQIELLRKVLLEFLKAKPEGTNKENNWHTANHPESREAALLVIHTQQKLLDKTEQLDRMRRESELEFELTRNFLSHFMKDMQLPLLKNEHVGIPESIVSYKRRDSGLMRRSFEQFSQCPTEREPIESNNDQSFSNLQNQNKTLAKLNKLEKFLLKMPKTTKHSRQQQGSTMWNFSPTKAEYKLENESLKVLQEHLRSRLSDGPAGSDGINKQASLKLRQRRVAEQEQELFRKEVMMNRRHMEIIRKEKQLKGVA